MVNFGIVYSEDYLEAASFRFSFSCFELGYSRDFSDNKDYFTFAFKKNFSGVSVFKPVERSTESSDLKFGMSREEILKKAEDAKKFQDYFEAFFYYRLLVELDPTSMEFKNSLEEVKGLTYSTWRTNQRFREINNHLSQATKLLEQEQFKLSEYEFQQVQKLEPENSDAQNGLLEILERTRQLTEEELKKAETAFEEKNFPGLIVHIGTILSYDPANERAKVLMDSAADYYKKLGDESGSVIREHQQNLRRIEMLETYISAMTDLESGNLESALEKLTRIRNYSTDNDFILDKITYITRLKNESADFDSEKVLQLYREGLEFYTQGDFTNAILKWEEVLKIDPFNTSAIRGIQRAKKMMSIQE